MFSAYRLRHAGTGRFVFVGSVWGGLQVANCSGTGDEPPWRTGGTTMSIRPSARRFSGWQALTGFGTDYQGDLLGFRLAYGDLGRLVPRPMPFWSIRIPYWFLFAIFSPPALVRLGLFLKRKLYRRRQEHGFCPACGYDLRASRERCPECGMPVV